MIYLLVTSFYSKSAQSKCKDSPLSFSNTLRNIWSKDLHNIVIIIQQLSQETLVLIAWLSTSTIKIHFLILDLVYVVYQIHYSIWKVKFTSYNHIYSRMNLVVKTSGGYYFAHYIHFTRYGMHAYIELGFYPGGILRGKFYFLLQSYVFMILVFHWKERNLALGQKKRNGVWVEEKG